jgi:hypothetical protein
MQGVPEQDAGCSGTGCRVQGAGCRMFRNMQHPGMLHRVRKEPKKRVLSEKFFFIQNAKRTLLKKVSAYSEVKKCSSHENKRPI